MLTCTSLFSRFSSNAHHHGSLPQQLEGGLRPAPESRSRGAFPHLSRSLFTRLVHNALLIRVLLQHTKAKEVERLRLAFSTCTGSLTAQDSGTPRDIGAPDGAFRFLLQRRRPVVVVLRGSIPGPHVPLSTLRRRPCERLRMTRGRCGSLIHIRMTFAFTTPRRFNRRTGES